MQTRPSRKASCPTLCPKKCTTSNLGPPKDVSPASLYQCLKHFVEFLRFWYHLSDADEALTHSILSEAVSGNVSAISILQRARTARHHHPTLQSSAATSASSPMRKRGLAGAASQSGHTLDKSLPRILQGLSFCHPEYASIAGLLSTVAKQLQVRHFSFSYFRISAFSGT